LEDAGVRNLAICGYFENTNSQKNSQLYFTGKQVVKFILAIWLFFLAYFNFIS